MGPETLKGLRVTVMGLGRFGGGIGVIRYLAAQGAVISLTDSAPTSELEDSLLKIQEIRLQNTWFGEHPDCALNKCDLLVVNPAVKPNHDFLKRAEAKQIPRTTELELFWNHLKAAQLLTTPAPLPEGRRPVCVIAVTGTNGKSSTVSLIQHLLQSFPKETVPHTNGQPGKIWLGGNIGRSLLPDIDRIASGDTVILELSSFQLHLLQNSNFAPDIAVLTNFTTNHLDWHKTVAHYHAAKQILFARQRRDQKAILPVEAEIEGGRPVFVDSDSSDEDQPQFPWRIRAQLLRFGLEDHGDDGVYFDENALVIRHHGIEDALRISLPSSLAGRHAQQNLSAAVCAAMQTREILRSSEHQNGDGNQSESSSLAILQSIARAVSGFPGVPHRLEHVATHNGIRFINDSASTTPESTMSAIQTLTQGNRQTVRRLVVIFGGGDKGADLSNVLSCLSTQPDGFVLIGAIADQLHSAFRNRSDQDGRCQIAEDLPSAFAKAVELAGTSGIVLLSPGCSSYGWFRDFTDRGEQFRQLVGNWIQE